MKDIQTTKHSGPPNTIACSYVTKDIENYQAMQNLYKMNDEIKHFICVPHKPFTVPNALLYYNNRLCKPKKKFRLKLFHDMHESP